MLQINCRFWPFSTHLTEAAKSHSDAGAGPARLLQLLRVAGIGRAHKLDFEVLISVIILDRNLQVCFYKSGHIGCLFVIQHIMNNTFFDNRYQIKFLIPFARQLTTPHAEKITREFISGRKESYYQAWKSRPENKDWTGNIDAKKEELFIESHKPNSEILVIKT
ncbi:MAG: hypothetical protein ABR955_15780 [Verrucomicrobiota bacterium]|jgi:hypothetical protein